MVLVWAGSGRWMGCCKGAARAVTMLSLSLSLSPVALVTIVWAALVVIGVGSQGCSEGGGNSIVVIVISGSSHYHFLGCSVVIGAGAARVQQGW